MEIILIPIFVIVMVVVIVVATQSYSPAHIGAAGESKVSGILQSLPDEYRKINGVIIPNTNGTTQIDHIVVSRYGVFVIETKNYSGWIFGANNSKKWKQTFRSESYYFYNPIKQNWGHIYALSEFLKLNKTCFKPVVVFSDDATLNITSATPVIHMSELRWHLLSFQNVILTAEKVEDIYNTLMRTNLVGKEAESRHTEAVKYELSRKNAIINQRICPRCGGNLVLRNGKYGHFYGCSNYPKCRFTHDI